MRRALLCLALCACSLRNPRVDVQPCSSSRQCDQNAVCFLGECRPHSASLSVVTAEIQPPNTSAFGTLQVGGIDLQQKAVQDFKLVQPLAAAGTVVQLLDANAGTAPVPDAVVTLTQHAPPVPDRAQLVVSHTDPGGAWTAKVPQGTWDVLVQPSSPLPPYRPGVAFDTSAPAGDFALPSVGSLARVQNVLLVAADGGPVPGADVTAVDTSEKPLSTPAVTQADGGFSLQLPPGTVSTSYFLQVGPPPDADGGTPLPSYDLLPPAQPVQIDLPPVATMQGQVVDSTGAPVAAARVYARHDGPNWTLARSTAADANGMYSLALREGSYTVEAAPPATVDAPAISQQVQVTLPSAAAVNFVCPPRLQAFGLITRADGTPVGSNFQITATRLTDGLITTRSAFTTPTGTDGVWKMTADPGTYRIEVVPTADSGLPRKIVQIPLPATGNAGQLYQMTTIPLSPPLLVGGTVTGNSQPVVNATVSFFALDAAGHGVLLGTAPTDANGHYTVVLPDVAQPGVASSGK